jgi:ABC-type uncharacterized transport system substrate-binding protein
MEIGKKDMKRKITVLTICAWLYALCVPALAQQPGKVFRIGFLDSSTASGMAVLFEAFWQEMRKLGWIQGKNIAVEYRFAEGKNDRLPELAADLVRLKVDLIVVSSGGATNLAAKKATSTIPIVLATSAERKRIVELAGKYRLPAIYFQKEFVDEGGLMSYGTDHDELFRKAAHYVDKILKGTKPSDLPVQQATKFEFVINLKAAKQIGLTIPPDVLARANRVVR